jgi:hypothetical protein
MNCRCGVSCLLSAFYQQQNFPPKAPLAEAQSSSATSSHPKLASSPSRPPSTSQYSPYTPRPSHVPSNLLFLLFAILASRIIFKLCFILSCSSCRRRAKSRSTPALILRTSSFARRRSRSEWHLMHKPSIRYVCRGCASFSWHVPSATEEAFRV